MFVNFCKRPVECFKKMGNDDLKDKIMEFWFFITDINPIFAEDKPSLGSVEENLLKVAASQGIVNFGIDYLGRDKLAPNSAEKKNEAKGTPEETKLLLDAVAKLCNAYEAGNGEEMAKSQAELSALLGKEAINPNDNAIRDDAMAKNINALLPASETVGNKLQEDPPKQFFGLGTNHLLEGVPAKLAAMGWDLEEVKQ